MSAIYTKPKRTPKELDPYEDYVTVERWRLYSIFNDLAVTTKALCATVDEPWKALLDNVTFAEDATSVIKEQYKIISAVSEKCEAGRMACPLCKKTRQDGYGFSPRGIEQHYTREQCPVLTAVTRLRFMELNERDDRPFYGPLV